MTDHQFSFLNSLATIAIAAALLATVVLWAVSV